MRTLFDQYSVPENRLTHALLCSLDKDRRLLKGFLIWVSGHRVQGGSADVIGQGFPGDVVEYSEQEGERRGIPDGCIADGSGWALLLESKFAAQVNVDQLHRHLRSARRHGIDRPVLLLITVGRYTGKVPPSVRVIQWLEIYAWLQRQLGRSQWAKWCAEYFEIAEAKESQNGYLTEGTLTVFTGIPFGSEPYNYVQAKRLLGLLRGQLTADKRLARVGADLEAPGRGAIKGKKSDLVWDFIPLRAARKASNFTRFPHLTFSLHTDRVETYATIPNGVERRIRRGILGKNYEEFAELIGAVARNLAPLTRVGAKPMVVLVQRHYPSQSAPPIADATLRFDPRTAFRGPLGDGKAVKYQPEWLQGIYQTLRSQRSNLQLQVGVEFRYDRAKVCATPRIAQAMADAWIACRPVLEKAL